MTTDELLERLKKADSFTWGQIRIYHLNFFPTKSGKIDDPEIKRNCPLEEDVYLDIIQGCIQRACERWGWDWQVARHKDREFVGVPCKEYLAFLDRSKIGEFEPGFWDGDSPTEAILVAYLAAIEGEAVL